MIYLDHAATTPIFPEVLEAMLPWYQSDHVGNASSIHSQGFNAFRAVEEARRQVAQLINADPSEIFFTSGGTESNNTFLRCLEGNVIVTTKLEHQSILEQLDRKHPVFISSGRPVWAVYASVNTDGTVDLNDLETKLEHYDGGIGAVSIMWVNNELGTINPMEEIGALCKKYRVSFHTDAVQAVGHVPIDVKKCNVDMLSMSGHKFGAPLGIGALYINSRICKRPLIHGGGQEQGMRGGTYNVPGIVGIGKAAEIVRQNLDKWEAQWRYCRGCFQELLRQDMSDLYWINCGSPMAQNIISLTIPNVNSESLLLLLDRKGICLSAGSACSSASSSVSHVLKGIGLSDDDAASTVRISMGVSTTKEEMSQTAKAIAEAVRKLKSMYS